MKLPSGPGSPRPSDDESIAATAAAWLAQRDDTLTPTEAVAFALWRAADSRHEAAVARLENTWAALQPLRDFRPAAARHPDRDLLAAPVRGQIVAFPFGARAFAFATAAALMLALGWWSLRPTSTDGNHYATTAGGYERVMLADGSVLELNSDTAAEVSFTTTERRVRLARGEAHFTVAKNPARPFWVEAGGVAVRAVGTAFNVRLGARDVEVLVTEGKVSVSETVGPTLADAAPALRSGLSTTSNATFLTANERVLLSTTRPATTTPLAPAPTPLVEHITPEAVRDALSWQGPRLVFVDTPLAEAVAQFNRRNTLQLVLADPALATLPVGGGFRPENVEAFVRLLESSGDVVVERNDPSRLVLRRGK